MSTETDFVSEALRHDADAIRFLSDATGALAFWDNMVDGKQITMGRVHGSMWATLVELPANPFYRKHFDQLHPVLRMVVLQWMSATMIERDENATDDALMLAFVDSQAWTQLLLACVLAIAGSQATAAIAPNVRRFGMGGGFAKYVEALRPPKMPAPVKAAKPHVVPKWKSAA